MSRGEATQAGDSEAARKKSLHLNRLSQAIVILANYCRQHRIPF
ncbi:MAG: hypothetical protein ACE5I9_03515 [Candidatus Methylomirabilales bacterium]